MGVACLTPFASSPASAFVARRHSCLSSHCKTGGGILFKKGTKNIICLTNIHIIFIALGYILMILQEAHGITMKYKKFQKIITK